jgi:hypothetical protein
MASSSVVSWKPLPKTEDGSDGEERRGFNACTSFRCELAEMPASVSSVNAPPKRFKPCLRITKETRSPGEGNKWCRNKELVKFTCPLWGLRVTQGIATIL